MKSLGFYCFIVFFSFITKCSSSVNILNAIAEISTKPIENILTNFPDFIEVAAENGYKAEKHEVTTEDGYILTVHRIPPGPNCTRKTPMLVMHGAMQSSEAFLDAGPEAPGFLMAKDCYDVWFGNVRGNYHSRRHVRLDPDKDLEFWKFSVDQIGFYDIPAMIDHVLDTTNSKKLIYTGFSQGGGSFVIANSGRPEYASKITLFVGLAPFTRLLNTRSASFRTVAYIVNILEAKLEAIGVWEILTKGFLFQEKYSLLCQVKLLAATVCGLVLDVLDEPHPGSFAPSTYKRLSQHTPAGTSVQNLAYFGQAIKNEKFTKFNYGAKENMKVYGSSDPPAYDFKAAKVPAVIYQGLGDYLVNPIDQDWAVGQLPDVLDYIKIKDPLWNHLDMTYSRYWKENIYVTMKKYLSQYDNYY